MPGWATPLIVTVLIEVPVVAALYPGQRRKMAAVAALSTTATNLLMNVVLIKARWLMGQYVFAGEMIALVAEAAAYVLVARPRDVARGLFASALANALSFGAGFVL